MSEQRDDSSSVAEDFEAIREAYEAEHRPKVLKPEGKGKTRPIKVYDPDTGETIATVGHEHVIAGLLKRAEIEAEVVGTQRPTTGICEDCRAPFEIAKKGVVGSRCVPCRREKVLERRRKWREENREKELERQRKWREENHEKERETKRKWHEKNREKVLERQRKWREENREKELERQRKWHKKKRLEKKRSEADEG